MESIYGTDLWSVGVNSIIFTILVSTRRFGLVVTSLDAIWKWENFLIAQSTEGRGDTAPGRGVPLPTGGEDQKILIWKWRFGALWCAVLVEKCNLNRIWTN